MRVLIFGGGGGLAHALTGVFKDTEHVLLDRRECDITDAIAVEETMGRLEPTVLINTAAYNDVDRAEEEPEQAMRVNGAAVGILAKIALKQGMTLVHFTTDYVFDGQQREGYRESDAPNPINAYGRSKRQGELELEQVARQGNLKYYCVRTSRLFGPLGSSPRAKKSFVDSMLGRLHEPTVQVLDADMSSPTFTTDLASAVVDCLRVERPFGLYHLINQGSCTRFGFAKEIFRQWSALTGQTVPAVAAVHDVSNRRAKRPAFSVLLNTKAPPLRSWHEALAAYLKEKIEAQ